MEVFDAAQERIEGPSWDCDTGPRLGPQNENPKKSTYCGISVFQNSKIIGLFRCHWGGPKKVEQKSIRYVFVQTKALFGQNSKIFFQTFGTADLRARARYATISVIVVCYPTI